MTDHIRILGHSRAENAAQLRNVLDTFMGTRRFETLRDGPVSVNVTLAARGDEQVLLMACAPMDTDIDPEDYEARAAAYVEAHTFKSQDGERYRYLCKQGPLDGCWLETPERVTGYYRLPGGKYILADAGLLVWYQGVP